MNKPLWEIWRNKLNGETLDVKIEGCRVTAWKQRFYGSGDLVFSNEILGSDFAMITNK